MDGVGVGGVNEKPSIPTKEGNSGVLMKMNVQCAKDGYPNGVSDVVFNSIIYAPQDRKFCALSGESVTAKICGHAVCALGNG